MLNRSMFCTFNNLNLSRKIHGKETFMRFKILLAALMGLIVFAISSAAFAATPFWSIHGDGELSGDSIRLERGKEVGVFVSVDTQGTLKAPQGWKTEWTAGKCGPTRPQNTCGTWEARKTVTANDNPTFSYKSDAGARPETKVFVLNVLATGDEKFATKADETLLEKRVSDVESKTAGTSVTAGLYYSFVPNLSTTTQAGHGLELNMGASVIDGLYIGGAFGFSRTQIPIDRRLNPVVASANENRYLFVGRIGWYPKFGNHFRLLLGGQMGAEAYSYNTTFTRQVAGNGNPVQFVRENTQYAFTLGPVVAVEFPIVENFGLGLQFTLPIAVNNISRTIGEGTDMSGISQTPSGTGVPQANPTLSGGVKFWF